MSVIIILIAISLSMAVTFLLCFVWAVRSGQYEDTLTPAMRILTDDPRPSAHRTDPTQPKPTNQK